jgi:cell fate (sporulation/competence/biofilm development) regulator YlbF (YheA/YmcA/DUF963 family)
MNIRKIVEAAMTSFVKAPTTRDARDLAQAIEGDGVGTADVSGQHVEIQHDARASTKTMVRNAIKRFRATQVTGSGTDLDARKVTESAGLTPRISGKQLMSKFKNLTGAEFTQDTYQRAKRSTDPQIQKLTKEIKTYLALKTSPQPAGAPKVVVD